MSESNATSSSPAAMLAYVEARLMQMEYEIGERDDEARQALERLRAAHTAGPTAAGQSEVAGLDEQQVASLLDRVQEQLAAVEARVEEADPATQQLLRESTSLWLPRGTASRLTDTGYVAAPQQNGGLCKQESGGKADGT